MVPNPYSEITPKIRELAKRCLDSSAIEPTLYTEYKVNRGLRDLQGNGVLTGLTEISEIQSSKMVDGQQVPCEGKLFYRGIDVEEIVAGFTSIDSALRKPPICCCSATSPPGSSSRIFSRCCLTTAPCPPASCGTSS